MIAYLIHAERGLPCRTGARASSAQHYIGITEDLESRELEHAMNDGARLIRAWNLAGIGWRVVLTWVGVDRTFERKLKDQNNAPRMCPVCKEAT